MNLKQKRMKERMARRFSTGDGVEYQGKRGFVNGFSGNRVAVYFEDRTADFIDQDLVTPCPSMNQGKYGGPRRGGSPGAGFAYGKFHRKLHGNRVSGIQA